MSKRGTFIGLVLIVTAISIAVYLTREQSRPAEPPRPRAEDGDGSVKMPGLTDAAGDESGALEPASSQDAATKPADERCARLEVVVIDGLTLEPIPKAWVTLSLHPGGGPPLLPPLDLPVDTKLSCRANIRAPAGYVNRVIRLDVSVAPTAERLVATVPVWPEARIRVKAVDGDRQPIRGAGIKRVQLGKTKSSYRAEHTDAAGNTVVGQVPWIPGDRVTVCVEMENPAASTRWAPYLRGIGSIRMEGRTPQELDLEIVLDGKGEEEEYSSSREGGIGLGGGGGGVMRLPPADAGLEVTALLMDGTPAAGVRLIARARRGNENAVTDESGRAVFEGLTPPTAWVQVLGVGYLFGPGRKVALSPGETARVTIREEPGRELHVQVLDHDERPVTAAEVSTPPPYGVPITHVEDGVQRIMSVSDRGGWVHFPRVPAEITVEVRYGSRSVEVVARPDDSVLVIRLPEP